MSGLVPTWFGPRRSADGVWEALVGVTEVEATQNVRVRTRVCPDTMPALAALCWGSALHA